MSNTGMNQAIRTTDNTDERLTGLEIKATYTEDLLEQLDAIIVRQQQQIDRLVREVTVLRQSHEDSATSSRASGEQAPRDSLPPHF